MSLSEIEFSTSLEGRRNRGKIKIKETFLNSNISTHVQTDQSTQETLRTVGKICY